MTGMNFAVLRTTGPAWDPALPIEGQPEWTAHAAFMNALADDGFIVLGGPVGDRTRFLFLVTADGADDIRERLAADPWVPMELLEIASIEPWEVLLGKVPED
jgi:uncharacterized protein YciI